MKYSNLDYIRAHQYLYYCKNSPVISDHNYDIWGRDNCEEEYKNGSDLESSYSKEQKELACLISKNHTPAFPQN